MGCRTTADENLDSAHNQIKLAIKDLAEIVVEECSGHDDFNREYSEEIEAVFYELIKISKRLSRK